MVSIDICDVLRSHSSGDKKHYVKPKTTEYTSHPAYCALNAPVFSDGYNKSRKTNGHKWRIVNSL